MQMHQIPLYKTYDVIGYSYAADTWCVGDCITRAVGDVDPQSGLVVHVEQALDEIAAQRGNDREREDTFDASVFPKRITAGEEFDRCPRCRGCGGVLDSHDTRAYPESE